MKWQVLVKHHLPPGLPYHVIVVADYEVVESGALIFRKSSRSSLYPTTVRVFAAGHWLEVLACPHAAPIETTDYGGTL